MLISTLSTRDLAVAQLSQIWSMRSILHDQHALGFFLDITSAFDNLSVQASIQGMSAKCIPPYMERWYSNYLCLWSVMVKIKGISTTQSLMEVTPWGHLVSPGVESGIWWPVGQSQLWAGPYQGLCRWCSYFLHSANIYTFIEWGARGHLDLGHWSLDMRMAGADKTEVVVITHKRLRVSDLSCLCMGSKDLL